MKDIISKLTFGFLMAQFVPGAIAVCSIGFLYAAFTLKADNSIWAIMDMACARWDTTWMSKLLFIAVCTGAGMLIHGTHWAVLAYLETPSCTLTRPAPDSPAAYKTFWHGYPVIFQVLLGPLKIVIEILCFSLKGKKIINLATRENVIHINKDKMEAFNFLQDFYLHFAQFYAHTSYAIMISFLSLVIFVCFFGLSVTRIIALLATYLFTGFFFVIGRIQLATLFEAERQLVYESTHMKMETGDLKDKNHIQKIPIELMREDQVDEAIELVSTAMNADEGKWARKTMEHYFKCQKYGIDSGREYYIWRKDGRIYGLVGLHRYIWGPEENVWLSWFAVHPDRQGKGAGGALIEAIKERAVEKGFKKLLIETYDSKTFDKARSFYERKGFHQIGRIESYLPDGSAMLVYVMEIAKVSLPPQED